MKRTLLSALLVTQLISVTSAQTNFDTTGLTLIDENVSAGCGEIMNVYEDSEGWEVYQYLRHEPTVNGRPLSELTVSDLSNERVHFQTDGTPLNDSVAGREDAGERLVTYSERQLFNFHKTQGFALREYGNWYRARVAANVADELSNDIMKALVKTAIKTTLKYTVPGSEEVVSLVGDIAENAYDPLVDAAFDATPDDPEAALQRLAQQFEDNALSAQIQLNTLVSTTSNRQRREAWDLAVREFIIDRICYEVDEEIRDHIGAPGTIGPTVAHQLEMLGLPVNVDEQAQARIRQRTIRKLVRSTIRNESHLQLLDHNHLYGTSSNITPDNVCLALRPPVNECIDQRTDAHTSNIVNSRNNTVDESNSCVRFIIEHRGWCD